jgi:hypothetical protein
MVMVGLSGGVDSSVAALLLQREGIRLEALFMKNWEEDDDAEYCAAAVDLADAQGVATTLDIPLHAVNFAHDYWERVFEHFLSEYRAGRTPNPDVLTTPASPGATGAGGCCAAGTVTRTRAISCTRSTRSSWRTPDSRLANSRSRPCAGSRVRPGWRLTTAATAPGSAS